MLRDKGVLEFVEAARLLRARRIAVRCVLVGAPDAANPSSLPLAQLEAWQAEGVVEWWGLRDDMAQVLRQCHVACLPSYREGLPKFLLEAMACALPVVSTDVTGCREAVEAGRTGILVPARDGVALAAALEWMAHHGADRRAMGMAGRERVLRLFDRALVIRETMQLYGCLAPAPSGQAVET